MAKRGTRRGDAAGQRSPKRKIPVYLDRDIPAEIVRLIRENEANAVRVVGVAEANMEDRAVWRAAVEAGAILTTHDEGFWSDRRYPLHDSPGVLLLKGATTSEILEAMERFTEGTGFVATEREWPGYFRETKVRATRGSFTIKFITADSQVVTETYSYDRPSSGLIFTTDPEDSR